MAARAEKAASSCCWGAGPSAWPGLTGRFPSPSPGISVSLCPWAGRGALRPVTGQPHPQPLAPGLFARSSGQRAAVAKRCPPPQYHLHLEGCRALTCVRPFSLLESAAHPASPLLQTASDGALQALTTPLPGLRKLRLSQRGLGGHPYECIFWAPGHLIQSWSFSSVSCWKGHPLIPQGRASERLDTGL